MDRVNKSKKRQMDWRTVSDRIRSLARSEQFILSSHTLDKLEENDWTIDDLLSSLMTCEVLKAEADHLAIDGKKYTVCGTSDAGVIESVGKFVADADGKQYFVITCY